MSPDPGLPLDIAKKSLRRVLRARRRAVDDLSRTRAARLCAHVLRHLADHHQTLTDEIPGCAAGYWPAPGEIDCRPILAALARMGWTTALPALIDAPADAGGMVRAMEMRSWSPARAVRGEDPAAAGLARAGVMPGGGGPALWQPPDDRAPVAPTLILVPLLGFDRHGGRLGQGGGFYDRYLAEVAPAGDGPMLIGVAYAAQQVDAVPREPHDRALPLIATEDGLIAATA